MIKERCVTKSFRFFFHPAHIVIAMKVLRHRVFLALDLMRSVSVTPNVLHLRYCSLHLVFIFLYLI